MAKQWHMVCLWIIWHFQTSNVTAFNLDTENVLQRNGDPGSLFGFSVAFHQQLLVGAPRAKHQNQVNVTGVVYKCDLTTTSKSCQPIEFDDKGFKGINNQWMGVRVTSQGPGKNVMVRNAFRF
uniref:Integrin alpha-2 domain-containing protein n=2 Tax=Haplochromini TaxID=319058 RepID=A0A3Q3BTF6_HAPBU